MLKKKLLTVLLGISLVLTSTFATLNVFAQPVSDDLIDGELIPSDCTYAKVYDASNYKNPYATDRIIVALKADSDSKAFLESSGLTLIKTLSATDKASLPINQNVVGLYSVADQTAEGVIAAINEIKSNPAVAYAEPDYILTASDTVPNDPSFPALYGMAKISAPKAWDQHYGTKKTVVGVIDTGIDYNHPDLRNNIWKNPGEIANNGIDDDSNGYVDDIYGWNFVNNTNNPMDDNSHGTHVSGTIGAVGYNGTGVVGVTWNTQLAALKFLDSEGSGYTSNAVLAVTYAAIMNFDICSNSWGGYGYSQSLRDAIASCSGISVCAAGNDYNNNDTNPCYPASYDCSNIIAVAATDSNDNKPAFSNYGATTVDLGAPGYNIYSTSPNSSYATMSGTSMATPHVSGAAALIKSFNPTLTASQIKSCILDNVDPVSSLSGITVTGGRLNVAKCIASANADLIPVMVSNTYPSGIASASSVYNSSPLYAPWKAFDGNNESDATSRWISSAVSEMPQWISYCFGQSTYVGSYHILPELGGCADRAPMNFSLQGSNDDINWTTLDSRCDITLSTWNNSGKAFNVSYPGSYKTYRLYVTATNGSQVVSIQQFKLFTTGNPNLIPVMTSNTTPSGIASASSIFYDPLYAPWKAFDGNNEIDTTSRWISSVDSEMPQWISYKFDAPVIARNYYILPEIGYCEERAPKDFILQGSNNGTSWTNLDTRSNITLSLYNAAGLSFSVNNPGSYTYYRLYITATNDAPVVSIQQIKLFE